VGEPSTHRHAQPRAVWRQKVESAATQVQSLAATGIGYGAVFVEVGVGTELGQIRVHQGMGAPLATSLSRSRSR
jgi:hypothetical protein